MKVGIVYYVQPPSLFASGRGQCALFLAEAVRAADHEPVLVNLGEADWWSDGAADLKTRFPRIHAKDLGSAGLDLLVDVDAICSPFVRSSAKCRCVALFRGHVGFEMLEQANYIRPSGLYTLKGVEEIWVWDLLNTEEELPSLRTLFEDIPVRRVPFVWSPMCLEDVHATTSDETKRGLRLVLGENNTSTATNCIVPFVGAVQWETTTRTPLREICILNATALEKDAYFQRNIVAASRGARDIPLRYAGRVPYADLQETDSLVITHLRFQALRPGLLDLAWLGIPFVHNSTFLQETGRECGLADNYYEGNRIECMGLALDKELQQNPALLQARRQWAATICAPTAPTAVAAWRTILQQPLQRSLQKPLSPLQRQQAMPLSSPTSPLQRPFTGSSSKRRHCRIGFTDFWEGFACDDNWFLDILRQTALFCGQSDVTFLGVDGKEEECELLLFGPFGSAWESVSDSVPKVFFSGERVDPRSLVESRVSLFLTHSPLEDNTHMRVPLWLLFLNWFTPEPHLQRNPNSLPWKWAVEPDTDEDAMGGRDFCAFVVSNPSNPVRNAAFEQVHSYKPVHSGGNYMNNIGGPIYHLYGGGGGGDVAKHAFLKKHTFCICYENSLAPGYVTEKLLHAKLAGCIPLYWGPEAAAEDFDPAGFVNFNGKESDLLQVIQQLEANPAALQKMAATPALDGPRLKKARETLLAVGRRLLQLLGLPAATLPAAATAATAAIAAPAIEPLMLSATSAAPAAPAATAAATAAAEPNPLFVTFATKSYLPSLESALHGWATLRKQARLDVITWLGHDISHEEEAKLRALYDWVTYKRLPQSSPVPDFPDFWTPKMFGWKLWILKTICGDASLADRLVLYSDAGAVWIDLPAPMIKVASQEGVCLLIDKEQINRNWCSPEMVRAMNVNEKELAQHQLMAFSLSFVAGHPVAKRLFDEAFLWGSKRECLFGPYFAGINASGQPYGHRHDQSILSILALRQKAPCIVGNPLTNLRSLRKTYQSGAAAYLHRGNYARHRRPLPGVDDVWVVSLDRRADRWASWKAAHPEMAGIANRLCAVDGKALALTPALFTLFEHNDFHWKKSVVGCALSHILLWAQLVSEHPDVQNYLIFEDDHRFKDPNWPIAFEKAMRNAPADAELLYFGGVLPGNKPAYKQCIQPVNEVWATIKPNNMFTGENGPMVPVFHFCAYSYLLTRKGAEKLLAVLRAQGCGTSIDHFLGWPAFGLKKYVMRDLLATCFQEDDPLYVNSQFDDMKRVDTFDSDIWNNAECFTAAANLSTYPTNQPQPPLWKCITDVLTQAPANIQTHRTLRENAVNGQIPPQTMQVFFHPASRDGQMEGPWLRDLFPGLLLQPFSLSAVLACPDPWLLFARPNVEVWNAVAAELERRKKSFSILHLSDEGCTDDLRAYASPFCKKVLRNYVRLDGQQNEKVKVLPLGYAAAPSTKTKQPSFADRSHVWSFHGTQWFDRPQQLAALADHKPFSLHFQDTFLDPGMTPITDYSKLLLDSKFVPAPRGNNYETFRFYEALEHGCIPLYVRTPGDAVYWSWLKGHLELVELKSWAAAAALVKHLLENPAKAEMYRQGLCKQWDAWKQTYRITGQ